MIYIPSTPGAAFTVAIPNSYGITPVDVLGKALRLELRNDVGLWTLDGDALRLDSVTPGWLTATGTAPALEEGEYTYRAYFAPDLTVSEGLLIVGDYAAERVQYEKPIQYEQYD